MTKYSRLSKEELLKIIEKQEKELKLKKYGLVWDREGELEQVVSDCENNLPMLKRVEEKQISFTADFEEIEGINKNVYEKFYNKKQYFGIENEKSFIRFLESQPNIVWWHKQSYGGRSSFAIEYFDVQEKESRFFYPDFIVRTKSKICLLDPKSGFTAKSKETTDKEVMHFKNELKKNSQSIILR